MFWTFAVSALGVIQQFTGLDLGWEEGPCFPRPWNHITCDGNLVTSMYVKRILSDNVCYQGSIGNNLSIITNQGWVVYIRPPKAHFYGTHFMALS